MDAVGLEKEEAGVGAGTTGGGWLASGCERVAARRAGLVAQPPARHPHSSLSMCQFVCMTGKQSKVAEAWVVGEE